MRAVGSGHSFTDIACTDGVLVDLARMRRVLAVDGADVTVEAGITLHELGEELARARPRAREPGRRRPPDARRRDLAPPPTARAGASATSPRRWWACGSWTAPARSVDVRDEDELRAARVGLGALGVIARRDDPLRARVHASTASTSRARSTTCCRASTSSWTPCDHFEAFVLPYTRTALTLTSERTDREPPRRGARAEALRPRRGGRERRARARRAALGRRRPGADPGGSTGCSRALIGRAEHLDASHRVYANERRVRFTEMEYAIPRERAAEALERVLALIERRRLPVGFPIELRVVAPRRRPALHRPRAPDRLHRRAPVPRAWSSRPTSAPSRRSWTSTAGARTGASATTSRPPRSPRATRMGALPGGPRRASTPRAASRTTTPPRARPGVPA